MNMVQDTPFEYALSTCKNQFDTDSHNNYSSTPYHQCLHQIGMGFSIKLILAEFEVKGDTAGLI